MCMSRLFVYSAIITMAFIVIVALYVEEKTNNNALSKRLGKLTRGGDDSGRPTTITLNCGFATIPCALQGGTKGVVACHFLPTGNSWWSNLASNATNITSEFLSHVGVEDHVNNATEYLYGLVPGEDSNNNGGGGANDDEEKEEEIITKCVDPTRASYGDQCGACAGDVIPRPCTQCACTIENGPQLGQPGFWLYKTSILSLHNHTVCATKERSIALQLEKPNALYGEYKCLEC